MPLLPQPPWHVEVVELDVVSRFCGGLAGRDVQSRCLQRATVAAVVAVVGFCRSVI